MYEIREKLFTNWGTNSHMNSFTKKEFVIDAQILHF